MPKVASLLALGLLACSGPPAALEYSEDPPRELTDQERLLRALDSLERERRKPPAYYPDPGPPAPP